MATLVRLNHLGQIATKDVKGVALHQHPREPPTGQANDSVIAAISEQLRLNALHHAIQPDITS
nr:hypothetical protein [Streptomyces albiflavescens]